MDALAPAVSFAMEHQPSRDWTSVVGLTARPRAAADSPGELLIYGRIGGGGWLMDGISASDVAAALRDLGPGPLNVRINSGGGDVFDGVAIHSLLARHPGVVTVTVDGLAASAASFIMLAGDRVVTSRNAMIMVHDGMTGVFGAAATLRRAVDLLDKVSDNIADMYAERAGEDVEYWRAKMTENGEDGVWFTGQEALDAGLVDEIVEPDEDEDGDGVDDYLSGWVDVLPAPVAKRVSAHLLSREARETEKPTDAVALDAAALTDIMKGVFA